MELFKLPLTAMVKINSVKHFLETCFFKFLIAGSIGFIVDASSFCLFHRFTNILNARIFAFLIAVTCTWCVNRFYTFGSKNKKLTAEWIYYVLVNSIAGLLNVYIFYSLVTFTRICASYPLIALVLANGVTMMVNFILNSKLVFSEYGQSSQ